MAEPRFIQKQLVSHIAAIPKLWWFVQIGGLTGFRHALKHAKYAEPGRVSHPFDDCTLVSCKWENAGEVMLASDIWIKIPLGLSASPAQPIYRSKISSADYLMRCTWAKAEEPYWQTVAHLLHRFCHLLRKRGYSCVPVIHNLPVLEKLVRAMCVLIFDAILGVGYARRNIDRLWPGTKNGEELIFRGDQNASTSMFIATSLKTRRLGCKQKMSVKKYKLQNEQSQSCFQASLPMSPLSSSFPVL